VAPSLADSAGAAVGAAVDLAAVVFLVVEEDSAGVVRQGVGK
jgi:hypothetical protein